jgi:hypothetical protein
MNRRGHTGRTDANHTETVRALLEVGCTVQSLASVGLGAPDLLVGLAGVNILIEVKNEDVKPSERGLNADQKKWHSFWKGQVAVAESPQQAVEIVRRIVGELYT